MADHLSVPTVGRWLQSHADLDRRDLEVLLCRTAQLTRAEVLARPERPLSPCLTVRLEHGAERLARGEPVSYVTGVREFWGLELTVTPAVLVPRPETELLVEVALHAMLGLAAGRQEIRVLELGTGTGAVAIALASETARRGLAVRITATDVSRDALAVAAANASRHGADVCWVESDWFATVRGRFHVIVANPPYVADDDPHLQTLRYEPLSALIAGHDGLDALRAVAGRSGAHLLPGGTLALEHGHTQGPAVRALLEGAGLTGIGTLADLAGLERVTLATAALEETCPAS